MAEEIIIPPIESLPDVSEVSEFTENVKLMPIDIRARGYDGEKIGPANWQAQALANRTKWLRERLLNISTRLVLSVNSKTGNVVVTYADVGADAAGTADALVTAHLTALDPHAQYFDETRADARYVQRSLANQSNGWLQLDASGKIPAAMLQTLASRYVVVANQAARLALASSANLTICAQADIDQLFYLNGGANPSVAANWVAGQSATVSGVSSVYGRTGAVIAQSGDYDADKITETAARKFATPAEKTAWNGKQAALVSGTNIRSLFGQSLLGAGNLAPTPAQIGSAAAVHAHTTADINDYTQKTQQLITASLEAGTGVTLGYNPINGKTIISASGGADGGGGYIVVDRPGVTAGQDHVFNISAQNAFNLAAYALKEETGASNRTYVVDEFNAQSDVNYHTTSAVIFDGMLKPYTGGNYTLSADGDFYSSPIQADGNLVSISVAPIDIVPILGSSSFGGYEVTSSGDYSTGYAWRAFSQRVAAPAAKCWQPAVLVTNNPPPWLQVKMPAQKGITSYQLAGRNDRSGNYWQQPADFTLSGSKDGTAWTVVDTQTDITWLSGGEVKTFTLSQPAEYVYFRLTVTAINSAPNNSLAISVFNLIGSSGRVVIVGRDGNDYTAASGLLTKIDQPTSHDDYLNSGFIQSGDIPSSELIGKLPITIKAATAVSVKTRYTPHSQIIIPKDLTNSAAWQQINAATLTAIHTGAGKVRVAVTRDLDDWLVWNGTAWGSMGSLSANTAGATTLINGGMTPTVLNAITAAQWAQLFASNNNVPDRIAFAFALDITDPTADVATIDRMMLNINDTSSWKLQTPAEVEIRWHTDSVMFRTVTAGHYKLAYQIP
ncbi:discoidin domain-containing protein [Pectobacteriaceae bacterium C52]|nr:discoidin domain-containing protein [Pectobacteriaceae bacterium C52]